MLEIDDKDIEEVKKRLGEFSEQTPAVITRALSRAVSTAKKEASAVIPDIYNFDTSKVSVKDTMKVKSYRKTLTAFVTSAAGSIPLNYYRFSPGEPMHGSLPESLLVTVKNGRTKRLTRQGFVANLNGNKIFRKKEGAKHVRQNYMNIKKRKYVWSQKPYEKMYGPSVPEMLSQPEVITAVEIPVVATYEKRLEHEINRALEGNK